MAVTLDLAKQWLKIDWNDEDSLIAMLIDGAKEELLKSGIKERESLVYDRAILMLVSHWYANRTGTDDSNDILSRPLTFGIQDAILKLKAEGDPDAQTTG
ncbi:head-tail connector protein [Bacillus smithii]|uniref:head-tail connector protein n=1 Tax=Bacillus smithii TaxID=1479 RepID=UPI003D232A4D